MAAASDITDTHHSHVNHGTQNPGLIHRRCIQLTTLPQ